MRGRRILILFVVMVVLGLLVFVALNAGGDEETPSELVDNGGGTPPTVAPTPTPTPIPNPVVVAIQDIPRGESIVITDTINPANINVILETSWPASWVTVEAFKDLQDVRDRIARSDIPRGTILLPNMLTDSPGDLGKTGSNAGLMIPPDKVAIAIPVDQISSLGWALRQGDCVDVLISIMFVDLDEEFQTELPNKAAALVPIDLPDEMDETGVKILQGLYGRYETDPFGNPINVIPNELRQRPRLVSQISVRDAEVLNVGIWMPLNEVVEAYRRLELAREKAAQAEDQSGGQKQEDPDGGAEVTEEEFISSSAKIAEDKEAIEELLKSLLPDQALEPLVLIVSPQDALVLKWASEAGASFHMVLRSSQDSGVRLADTEAVTLQYMMDRFRIALPSQLPYGLEPSVKVLERAFLEDTPSTMPVLPSISGGEPPR